MLEGARQAALAAPVGAGRPGYEHESWLALLLALFQQFSLVSPLANAVAIPLMSFVITPLVLLATLPGSLIFFGIRHMRCCLR